MPKHFRRAIAGRPLVRNGSRPRVRRPSRTELSLLRRWSTNSDSARKRRARAILMALDAHNLRSISRSTGVHPRTVQHWLRRFNQKGPDGLPPQKPTGRPTRWTSDTISRVRGVLDRPPVEYGYERMEWSLRTLADYLFRQGITPTRSPETLRAWLRKIRCVE